MEAGHLRDTLAPALHALAATAVIRTEETMRVNSLKFAIGALLASVASGQTPADPTVEKVFHFAHTTTVRGFQDLTNAIRMIADVRQASLAAESKTLAVRGTASQISMSEWLFRGLDQPAGTPPSPAKLEYAVPGASNDLVRVFYITNNPTPPGLQEIVNAVRSVGEIQRIAVCNGPAALVMRGTVAHISLAEWLVQGLDKPALGTPWASISQTLTAPELWIRGSSVNLARVFYLPYNATPQDLQESVNMIRSLTEIQRVAVYYRLRAIIARAAADQVALAEWLLDALAKPATEEAPVLKFDINSFVTRMFYLKPTTTPQGLQEIATLIRTRANLPRVVASTAARAIALRGTVEQVATAERLIKEMDTAR